MTASFRGIRKSCFILLGAAVFAFLGGKTLALSVPRIQQETYNWCWAACGQMILYYWFVDIMQCEQATDNFGIDCCPTEIGGDCDYPSEPNFAAYGFNVNTKNTHLLWSEVIGQIGNGRPFAFSWQWMGGGGHMMVASDYRYTLSGYSWIKWVGRINPLDAGFAWITYPEYVGGPNYTSGRNYYNIWPQW